MIRVLGIYNFFALSTRYEKKVSKDLFSIGNNAELEAASGCLDFHLCKKKSVHFSCYRDVGRSENPGVSVVIRWA